MKAPALILYLSVILGATVNSAVHLNTVMTQVGEDFSHWPSGSAVAALAGSWVLLVLAMALGVLLDERGRKRERGAPDDETRVIVKTPRAGDHRVTAKIVVTNNPRRTDDDSSDFELTLD